MSRSGMLILVALYLDKRVDPAHQVLQRVANVAYVLPQRVNFIDFRFQLLHSLMERSVSENE
jgi:hypothetical protein